MPMDANESVPIGNKSNGKIITKEEYDNIINTFKNDHELVKKII